MAKKETELQIAQKEAEKAAEKTNQKIEKLGQKAGVLVETLNEIQDVFDNIRGWSEEEKLTLEKLKKERLNWIQQVKKIEDDYKSATIKASSAGGVGVGAGIAVVTLGPTAAMGIATTFGVASTGTAISALSGAAATNAALAWLGGGALVAGGGGMAAGNFLLILAGPVGWSIAGASILGSGMMFLKGKNDKNRLEKIYTSISNRDTSSYKLAILELNERINSINEESRMLTKAIKEVRSYGDQYDKMTKEQQVRLVTIVNLMNSSTQLLINPILGLQPKYNEADLDNYLKEHDLLMNNKKRNLYILLANLLYIIKLDDTDKKLLWKSFNSNKEFLESVDFSKKEFELNDLHNIYSALDYKYKLEV